MTINIEYEGKKLVPMFGGSRVEVTYLMSHDIHGRHNQYRVTCRIQGIESLDLHMSVDSVEWLGNMESDSNDETLTNDGAQTLFEEKTGI